MRDGATEGRGRIVVRDFVAEQIKTRLALTRSERLTDHSSFGLCAAVAASINPRIGKVLKIGAALRYEF